MEAVMSEIVPSIYHQQNVQVVDLEAKNDFIDTKIKLCPLPHTLKFPFGFKTESLVSSIMHAMSA